MAKITPKQSKSIFTDEVLGALPTNDKIKKGIGNLKQAEKLSGRKKPEHQKRMTENNPMTGKVSPNRGKQMPQISEKIKGKSKPEGFGEVISKRRKELGLGDTWGGKQRPEQSSLMKDPVRNKGAQALREPWICEYCKKEGVGLTNYARWHGNNCKVKNG
jgi:hypothetical protein